MTLHLAVDKISVFRYLSEAEMRRLTPFAKVIEKPRGDAVLMVAERAPGIFIVGEGTVGVYPPTVSEPLVRLGKGSCFGEMSFLEQTTASATIRSEEDGTKLVLFLQSDLSQILDEDPHIGRAFYRGLSLTLSQKLRTTTDRITKQLDKGIHLFDAIYADTGSGESLNAVHSRAQKKLESTIGQLAECIRTLERIDIPEKRGTLAELNLKLSEIASGFQQFSPELLKQVASMIAFIESTQKSLRASSHQS